MRAIYEKYAEELDALKASGNLRILPSGLHEGRWILSGGQRMLNLSSNDYLGLASDTALMKEFREWLRDTGKQLPLSSSSSRLLTGNFGVFSALEDTLASLYGREEALVLSSGYHMNAGILPALCGKDTLILADKLVHASLIDGIRLSGARCIRYRHQDYGQLETLIEKEYSGCDRIIIVTESIFSMDGDTAPLQRLTELKRRRDKIMLYVDEAHAVGVRGERGLGLAEETGCIADIDLLCGTFGKALASVGAFVICDRVIKEYLVNRMRTLIFTTALPPLNMAWTLFVMERLSGFKGQRERLQRHSAQFRQALQAKGFGTLSESHIVPFIVGQAADAVLKAEDMRRKGFYVLPIRPPTVPEGTSRLRFSLTAGLTDSDIERLCDSI